MKIINMTSLIGWNMSKNYKWLYKELTFMVILRGNVYFLRIPFFVIRNKNWEEAKRICDKLDRKGILG